jgi:hypothetical protein
MAATIKAVPKTRVDVQALKFVAMLFGVGLPFR